MNASSRILAVIATVISTMQCAYAVADRSPNLLSNPDFENGLIDWSPDFPDRVDWVSDYDFPPPGDTGIGAGVLFAKGVLGQCVPVSASTSYTVSAWILSRCADASLSLNIGWYSDNCVNLQSTTSIGLNVNPGQWKQTVDLVDSPDNAQFASFDLAQLACEQASLIDKVVFSDQIFGDSFEQ